MTQEEKIKLQDKLGRKIRQFDGMKALIKDLSDEWRELESDPEYVELLRVMKEKRSVMNVIARRVEELAKQAKSLEQEIREMSRELRIANRQTD